MCVKCMIHLFTHCFIARLQLHSYSEAAQLDYLLWAYSLILQSPHAMIMLLDIMHRYIHCKKNRVVILTHIGLPQSQPRGQGMLLSAVQEHHFT